MKLKLIVQSLTATLLLTGCASAVMMGSGAFTDDLYYDSREPATVARRSSDTSLITSQDIAQYDSRVGQYQKANGEQVDNRDFSAAQKYYNAQNGTSPEGAELVYVAEDDEEYMPETGYWLGGFNGSSADQSYAERMVRFHGPFVGVSVIANPYFYFAHSSADWNIYVENNRTYFVPSWSNPFYDDFYYGYDYSWWRHNVAWGHYAHYGWPGYYDPWYEFSPYYPYGHFWRNGYGYGHSWNYYNHYYGYHYGWDPFYHGTHGHAHHNQGTTSNKYRYGVRGNSISTGGSNISTRPRTETSRGDRAVTTNRRTATSGSAYRSTDNRQQRSTYTRPSQTRTSSADASYRSSQGSRSNSTYTPSSSRSVRSSSRVEGSSSRSRSYGQSNSSSTNSYTPSRSTRQSSSSSSYNNNSSHSSSSYSSGSSSRSAGSSSGSRSTGGSSSRSGGSRR